MKLLKRVSSFIAAFAMMTTMGATAFAKENSVNSLPDQTTERKLVIHKYAPADESDSRGDGTAQTIPDTKKPLANVEFSIYKVAEIKDASIGEKPTSDDITKYAVHDNLVTTVKTDEKGEAAFLPSKVDGKYVDYVYLVVEKDNAAVSKKADPFYVSVPYTNPEGNGWLYTVNVYPKNNIKTETKVDKDVKVIGNKHQGVKVGEEFDWIIRGSVPTDLYQQDSKGNDVYAKLYKFTDTLDARLDYVGVELRVYGKDAKETVIPAADYTVNNTTNNDESHTLVITLKNEAMKFVAEKAVLGSDESEIRAYVKSKVNEKAQMGVDIENDVTLDYTNSTGVVFLPVTPDRKPEVHTGGLRIEKVDATDSNIKLKGAEFKIAKTEEDAKNGVFMKDAFGKEIVIVTDENGKGEYKGLAYDKETGTKYYLVETKAPSGYRLLGKDSYITVTVNEQSYNEVKKIVIPNSKKFLLPKTGGRTAALLIGIGVTSIIAAFALKKSQKKTVK